MIDPLDEVEAGRAIADAFPDVAAWMGDVENDVSANPRRIYDVVAEELAARGFEIVRKR